MKRFTLSKVIFSILIFTLSTILNAAPEFNKIWETNAAFKLPESVIYDKENEILYVSNMQDDPFKKDKNGFISKVDLNGKILKLKWIKGLNAPKGLAISKGKLYVGDVDQLVEIDIKKGKIIKKHDAIGAALLNDVAADTKGNIYVSDTFTDTIYRLNTFGQLTKWLYSPELQAPNGLHYEKGQLIVGSWGHPTDGWSAAEVGHLKIISLKTKKIKSLGNGKAVGNLDGVESDGNNAYYVADWVGGKLLHIQKNGSFKEVLKLSQGVADHEVIHDKNMIIIPMMLEGKLITYKIN
ncbi:MAG: SMP-30/gluconolactonase/LRE family protein [Methylophilaceae bacterium]|tara:strand:- start:459 stop:1343 length:885 start_codon:yes stop_codon:yes gene_type:complete